MPIQGPFPDGGYQLHCAGCMVKITCFSDTEFLNEDDTLNLEKFKKYSLFVCKDCSQILFTPEEQKEIILSDLLSYIN